MVDDQQPVQPIENQVAWLWSRVAVLLNSAKISSFQLEYCWKTNWEKTQAMRLLMKAWLDTEDIIKSQRWQEVGRGETVATTARQKWSFADIENSMQIRNIYTPFFLNWGFTSDCGQNRLVLLILFCIFMHVCISCHSVLCCINKAIKS